MGTPAGGTAYGEIFTCCFDLFCFVFISFVAHAVVFLVLVGFLKEEAAAATVAVVVVVVAHLVVFFFLLSSLHLKSGKSFQHFENDL